MHRISFFRPIRALVIVLGALWSHACDAPVEDGLLRRLSPGRTGIDFVNAVTETEDFNVLNFHYIYNGGGVGVADFNNDGLPDLVFSGNQVNCRLYLNTGDLSFRDVTGVTGIRTDDSWTTGVSIVDINADGRPDVFFSVGGFDCSAGCANLLYVNQGIGADGVPRFRDEADEYGLADRYHYTQQAAFFDYDNDGDLDVYLLRNAVDVRDKNMPSEQRFISPASKDRLLENRDGRFVDVSPERGIDHPGYGLGVTVNDFNGDLLPDLYVANDFLSSDLLYLNRGRDENGHRGFAEVAKEKLKHTSYNAMGVDVADVNNDARPDIMVLDMLPEDNERQKSMLGFMNYTKFQMGLRQGYHPQFVRNTLQIHNGYLYGELLPFSETGYLSGVAATDWSWTPLLADLDNDGDRDLYVTNGYGKDVTDLDFINYSQQLSPFGTREDQARARFAAVQAMPSITRSNYVFENEGELRFTPRNATWTAEHPTISNGAVYVDLDDDGDLDLVANNLNEPALVLENTAGTTYDRHYLKIRLRGDANNPAGIGATIRLWIAGREQRHYQSPVRGYLSCVDEIAHFGLGRHATVDSLVIVHPAFGTVRYQNVAADQTLEADLTAGRGTPRPPAADLPSPLFRPASLPGLDAPDREDAFSDFDAQPLLLRQLSRQGPCLAVADVDGRAGDEIFVGGARGVAGSIYTQGADGAYTAQTLTGEGYEDTAATFADLDGDGDQDLYVVSGGTAGNDFHDRIYLNDGRGVFAQDDAWRSPATSSGGCVVAHDFDSDGDVDLFVGGRVVPGRYPEKPRSYLLVNHDGRLLDMTDKLIDGYDRLGMVTDAVWSDYDGDGRKDLIVVGEWMPILMFRNIGDRLRWLPNDDLAAQTGLWTSIAAADLDGDGDEDYVLGNLGLNTRLHAGADEPLALLNKDYDGNGSPDPLIGMYAVNAAGERHQYPLHARDDVVRQLTRVKDRFVTYADFGRAKWLNLFENVEESKDFLYVNNLNSSLLINNNEVGFELLSLPMAAQLAPVQAIRIEDYDADGRVDILLIGNDLTGEKTYGWQDAGNGLLLRGDGRGNFSPAPTMESGFYVPGDGRALRALTDRVGRRYLLATQNGGRPLCFTWAETSRQISRYAR